MTDLQFSKKPIIALFLIEQAEALDLTNIEVGVNPGVGGTSFTTLRLAYELNLLSCTNEYKDRLKILIGVLKPVKIDNYDGIPILHVENLNQSVDVAILTGGVLNLQHEGRINIKANRYVSWIRHPYDWDKIYKSKAIGSEIISVGKAAYLSNWLIAGKHTYLENLFSAKKIRDAIGSYKRSADWASSNRKTITVGYMGALVESKAFHLLAQIWPEFCKIARSKGFNPNLIVIGGADLYGFATQHSQIPASHLYGNLISNLLGDEIHKSVHFKGTLSSERYIIMKDCNFAVVNPAGEGEAFPATILEWCTLGIPPIAPLRFGCIDIMRYLPELSIVKEKELLKKMIDLLLANNQRINFLSKKCQIIAEIFSRKQGMIIHEWLFFLLYGNQSSALTPNLNVGFLNILSDFFLMGYREVRTALYNYCKKFLRI